MEIYDRSSIIASNLTPQINLVKLSDDTLSAASDELEISEINDSSVAKSTFYAKQRLQQKLQNALKQSSNRLRKLRILREKYRRLTTEKRTDSLPDDKYRRPVTSTNLGLITRK